jgi:hypothetical protein
MLTETVISTFLTASITGAGLILAIYALITPMARKMFEERVEIHRKKMKEFDKMKKKVSSESSEKDFKRLKTLASEIQKIKAFPKYLGLGVVIVFLSYGVTSMLSYFWLIVPSEIKVAYEVFITPLFIFSTFGFFVVGAYAISDVYLTIKREFEQVKKEQEEAKKVALEYEETLKRILEAAPLVEE